MLILSRVLDSLLADVVGMGKVGGYLQQLKDGLHGTLFIASADESGATLLT